MSEQPTELPDDFCGRTVPVTTMTIIPVEAFLIPGLVKNDVGAWAACEGCAPYLRACVEAKTEEEIKSAIEELAQRALGGMRAMDGPREDDDETLIRFRLLYTTLLIYQSGDLRQWDGVWP